MKLDQKDVFFLRKKVVTLTLRTLFFQQKTIFRGFCTNPVYTHLAPRGHMYWHLKVI